MSQSHSKPEETLALFSVYYFLGVSPVKGLLKLDSWEKKTTLYYQKQADAEWVVEKHTFRLLVNQVIETGNKLKDMLMSAIDHSESFT